MYDVIIYHYDFIMTSKELLPINFNIVNMLHIAPYKY